MYCTVLYVLERYVGELSDWLYLYLYFWMYYSIHVCIHTHIYIYHCGP